MAVKENGKIKVKEMKLRKNKPTPNELNFYDDSHHHCRISQNYL